MPTYKKNYLEKVIFRLDFAEVSLAHFSKYYEKIRSKFPTKQQKEGFEGVLNVNFTGGEVQQVRKEITVYSLTSQDGKKRLEIAPKWAYIEYDKDAYVDSNGLIQDVANCLDLFVNDFSISLLDRIGLRYINGISLDEAKPLDWEKYIDPSLLGNLVFSKTNNLPIARSMGQLVVKDDQADAVFNFGVWNKDYPNQIARKEFLIDIDCYTRLPIDATEIKPSDSAKEFNKLAEKIFEASITDEFRKVLNK